jgi:hypothetical protein
MDNLWLLIPQAGNSKVIWSAWWGEGMCGRQAIHVLRVSVFHYFFMEKREVLTSNVGARDVFIFVQWKRVKIELTWHVTSHPSSRHSITEEPCTSRRSTTAPDNCIIFCICCNHSELSTNLKRFRCAFKIRATKQQLCAKCHSLIERVFRIRVGATRYASSHQFFERRFRMPNVRILDRNEIRL